MTMADDAANEREVDPKPLPGKEDGSDRKQRPTEDWPSSEGYTPLWSDDSLLQQSQYIFTDGHSSFVASSIVPLEEEENDDEDDSNYQSVAEKALASLEEDYKKTLASSSIPISEQQHSTEQCDPKHPELPSESSSSPSSSSYPFVAALDAEFSLIDSASASAPPLSQLQQRINRNDVDTYYPRKQELGKMNATSVKHAIQAMESKHPKMLRKFQNWEQTQARLWSHELIPSRPLAAFRKRSKKAIEATGRLTRAATIAEALQRLKILDNNRNNNSKTVRRIHVVGCDRVECHDPTQIRLFLGPIARWIMEHHKSPEKLEFHLIGPNVPIEATQWGPINLILPQNEAATTTTTTTRRPCNAVAVCHNCLYEKFIADNPTTPDMAIAFNAGVWGYQEWKTAIDAIMKNKNADIIFVFTAYTIQEADDDFETIKEVMEQYQSASATETSADAHCIWEPSLNAFASKLQRDTKSATHGRIYRENAAWQCWRFY
jgi:hypothetical protein